jgi:hypothetical protein
MIALARDSGEGCNELRVLVIMGEVVSHGAWSR